MTRLLTRVTREGNPSVTLNNLVASGAVEGESERIVRFHHIHGLHTLSFLGMMMSVCPVSRVGRGKRIV